LAATIWFYLLRHEFPYTKANKHTQFEDIGLSHELIFIVILGILSAKIAILLNHVLSKIIFLRVRLKNPYVSNRWKWCLTAALFVSITAYPVRYMQFGETKASDMFFFAGDL
jgi:hypothetical protein